MASSTLSILCHRIGIAPRGSKDTTQSRLLDTAMRARSERRGRGAESGERNVFNLGCALSLRQKKYRHVKPRRGGLGAGREVSHLSASCTSPWLPYLERTWGLACVRRRRRPMWYIPQFVHICTHLGPRLRPRPGPASLPFLSFELDILKLNLVLRIGAAAG